MKNIANNEIIPDGKYLVNIERIECIEDPTTEHYTFKWILRIISPDKFQGRLLYHYNPFASFDNALQLEKDVRACGIDMDNFWDFPHFISDLINIKVEVVKYTIDDKENTRIINILFPPKTDTNKNTNSSNIISTMTITPV